MKIIIFALLSVAYSFPVFAAIPTKIQGPDLITKEPLTRAADSAAKGLIVVFLSAKCPCSDSHVSELKSLAEKYKSFEFVAVHSNIDESEEMSRMYFEKLKLNFSIIQDTEAKIADEFKAYKTPHAFVVSPQGEVLYQGGVSDSKKFAKADKKFLREALEDIEAKRAVQTPVGRTLGCAISRGNEHVW